MNKEEILEGNKLIAEFIEYTPIYLNSNYNRLKCFCDEYITCPQCRGLEEAETYGYFHSSWDWLMPVVIKMASMKEYISKYESFYIEGNPIACFSTSDIYDVNLNLQILWNEVIEFIKWYNQNKLNETN